MEDYKCERHKSISLLDHYYLSVYDHTLPSADWFSEHDLQDHGDK